MEVLYWVKVLDIPRTRSIDLEGRLETRAALPWTGRQLNVDDFRRNQVLFRTESVRTWSPLSFDSPVLVCPQKAKGIFSRALVSLVTCILAAGPLRTLNSYKASLLTNWWMVLTSSEAHRPAHIALCVNYKVGQAVGNGKRNRLLEI